MNALKIIKDEIDQKVYDRHDILRQDVYFEQTVMVHINNGIDRLGFENTREDRLFIQSRLSTQYLNQYKATYGVA